MNTPAVTAEREAILAYLEVHEAFANSLIAQNVPNAAGVFQELKDAVRRGANYDDLNAILIKRDANKRTVLPGAINDYAVQLAQVEEHFRSMFGLPGSMSERWAATSSFPNVVRGLLLHHVQTDPNRKPDVWRIDFDGLKIPFVLIENSIIYCPISLKRCKLMVGISSRGSQLVEPLVIRADSHIGELNFSAGGTVPRIRILDSAVDAIRFEERSQIDSIRILRNSTVRDIYISKCVVNRAFAIEQPARVTGACNARGTEFKGETRFNGDFAHCPPLFDAELSSETVFSSMTLRGRPLGDGSGSGLPDRDEKERELLAIRHLRIEMQKRRWTREESRFFAEEQRLERELTPLIGPQGLEKCISFAYDSASCYGASVARAIGAFVLWTLMFLAIFFGASLIDVVPSFWNASKSSPFVENPWIALTLQNAANPLALLSDKPLVSVTSGVLWFFSLVQTIGSLSLFTLLLLALRGRFQRGGGGGSVTAG